MAHPPSKNDAVSRLKEIIAKDRKEVRHELTPPPVPRIASA
ncbi:MAG: hypothetical protein VKN33_09535 [Candidatus Sericytochromatia bacterium]|jgi:septum formation topological specificity factor MinE|nr:hypothetical protein [Candidatus Sericytochromatia bacterium]